MREVPMENSSSEPFPLSGNCVAECAGHSQQCGFFLLFGNMRFVTFENTEIESGQIFKNVHYELIHHDSPQQNLHLNYYRLPITFVNNLDCPSWIAHRGHEK